MPASDRRTGWSPATLQLLRWGPAGLILVALAVAAISLALGGGASPLTIGDPGPVVRWGLPIARLGFDLGASLTVGALSIAIFACSRKLPEFERAMTLAQGGSVAWALASMLTVAPSVNGEALPAVTRPWGRNGVLSPARPSMVVSGRRPSSLVASPQPLSLRRATGMRSGWRRPAS